MSEVTEITLANSALRLLGEFGVAALDEGTDLAETIQLIQRDTVRALLTEHPWRFTMRKAQLARLADAPINEWTHAHSLPADRLTVRAMRPSSAATKDVVTEYEIFDNRVYSHQQDIWCDYQVDVDPGAWPPYFTNLVRNALAADFAMAVGAGPTAGQYFHQRAFGSPSEGRGGGLMQTARRIDSQQQPPQRILSNPLLSARFAGRSFR
jgi:hypothetical protein